MCDNNNKMIHFNEFRLTASLQKIIAHNYRQYEIFRTAILVYLEFFARDFNI